jgi:hypothetical protein
MQKPDPQHPKNGLISASSYKHEFKQTLINCKYIWKVAACYPDECSKLTLHNTKFSIWFSIWFHFQVEKYVFVLQSWFCFWFWVHGYIRNHCTLAMLGHSVLYNLQQFPITFRKPTVPHSPTPNCKPNVNENRDNCKMFSALRSPPPATNRNQASSTAQCGQYLGVCMVTCSDALFSLWCTSRVNMESRLLHSRS